MKTIYVIESGTYSDHTYHAAFASKAVAEQVCQTWNLGKTSRYDNYNVSTMTMYTTAAQAKPFMLYRADANREWSFTTLPHEVEGPMEQAQVGKGWAWGQSKRSVAKARKNLQDHLARVAAEKAGIV
jgi:hypothetical protein